MAHSDNSEAAVYVFDPLAVRRHRERAARGGRRAEFLFVEGAKRLVERLDDINRRFSRALDLGCRGGLLSEELRGRAAIAWLASSDPAPGFLACFSGPKLAAEPEALPFAPGSFDLILSNLALHWVNDLPGALLQLRQALRPDGLLLASLFAGETLSELRESMIEAESEIENGASPRVSPFADARALAGLLQRAGFSLPVVDTDRIDATYSDALSLMRDLQAMGESNALAARRRGFTRRATLLRAAELYQARYAGRDGRIVAHFEIATLTAWAPDQSQPRPLRPGSAAARLADALGAQEESAGDAARPAPPRREKPS